MREALESLKRYYSFDGTSRHGPIRDILLEK